MQRGHQRHLQFAEQGQDVAAGGASEDAVFMLQTNEVIAIEVEELRGSLVRSNIFLRQFQANLFGVFIARIRIVDWNCKEATNPELSTESVAQVGRECGDPAFAR